MPEFDATTQFAYKPAHVSDMARKINEVSKNRFLRYTRDQLGRLKFVKNAFGQYLDKNGNVVLYNGTPVTDADWKRDENKKKPDETPEQYHRSVEKRFFGALGAVPLEEFKPREAYPHERIEEFSPYQNQILQDAKNLQRSATESKARPLLENLSVPGATTKETISNAQQLMNPYQDLFNAWEEQSREKFKKRLEKEINPAFRASRTWGSGPHRKLQHEALRENERDLRLNQSQFIQQSMKDAYDRGDKETERHLSVIRDRKNDEENIFKKQVAALGVGESLANQRQQLGQKNKSMAYEEWLKHQEYEDKRAKELSDITMGFQHSVPSELTQLNMGTHPSLTQPSSNTTNAGLAFMGASMLGKQGQQGAHFAEGGTTKMPSKKSHFGTQTPILPALQESFLGPVKTLSPLDIVKNKVNRNHSHSAGISDLFASHPLEMEKPSSTDAELPHLNTPEVGRMRKHATNLENTPHTPFWDALGGFGAGMLRSKGKNTSEMISGGGAEAWDTFNKSYTDKEAREDKITDLNKAIQDTRQIQLDREMKYRHEKDTLNIDKIKANADFKKDERRYDQDERKIAQEERKIAQHERLEMAKFQGKDQKLTPDQRKADRDSDNKIDATIEAIKDYETMLELAPQIHTGSSSKYIPNSLVDDWLPEGIGGTEGKQSLFDKIAEGAAQNRARAKFGNARIPVTEFESAKRTVPRSTMPQSGINEVANRELKVMKAQLKNLLKHRYSPYEGDLSAVGDLDSIEEINEVASNPKNSLQEQAQAILAQRKAH